VLGLVGVLPWERQVVAIGTHGGWPLCRGGNGVTTAAIGSDVNDNIARATNAGTVYAMVRRAEGPFTRQ
jgi:hypothetical protein